MVPHYHINDSLHFLANLVRDSRGIMYDLVLVWAVPYYRFAFKGVLYADSKEIHNGRPLPETAENSLAGWRTSTLYSASRTFWFPFAVPHLLRLPSWRFTFSTVKGQRKAVNFKSSNLQGTVVADSKTKGFYMYSKESWSVWIHIGKSLPTHDLIIVWGNVLRRV